MDEVFSPKQVAELLSMSRSMVMKHIRKGKLQAEKNEKGRWEILHSDIDAFLGKSTEPEEAKPSRFTMNDYVQGG